MTDQTPDLTEPINCGLCLYGSDVGVPGYDDKGPAYINPQCPEHNKEHLPEPTVTPTRYLVTCTPEDEDPAGYRSITVEYRGDNRYAVLRLGWCLGNDGEWDYEIRPSERDDDWLNAHRFDLDTALRLAKEQAPLVSGDRHG